MILTTLSWRLKQMISNTGIQFNILHHGCDLKTLCPNSCWSPNRNSDIYMALSTAKLMLLVLFVKSVWEFILSSENQQDLVQNSNENFGSLSTIVCLFVPFLLYCLSYDWHLLSYDWQLLSYDWQLLSYDWQLLSFDWQLLSYDWQLLSYDWQLLSFDWQLLSFDWQLQFYDWQLLSYDWQLLSSLTAYDWQLLITPLASSTYSLHFFLKHSNFTLDPTTRRAKFYTILIQY